MAVEEEFIGSFKLPDRVEPGADAGKATAGQDAPAPAAKPGQKPRVWIHLTRDAPRASAMIVQTQPYRYLKTARIALSVAGAAGVVAAVAMCPVVWLLIVGLVLIALSIALGSISTSMRLAPLGVDRSEMYVDPETWMLYLVEHPATGKDADVLELSAIGLKQARWAYIEDDGYVGITTTCAGKARIPASDANPTRLSAYSLPTDNGKGPSTYMLLDCYEPGLQDMLRLTPATEADEDELTDAIVDVMNPFKQKG